MTTLSTIPFNPKEQLVRVPSVGSFMRQLYVHNSYGNDDQYAGYTPERPLKTWDAAINRHAQNRTDSPTEYGCTIHLMPGHAETVSSAGGIAVDVNNIETRGHGFGEQRPTITIGSDSILADINFSGSNLLTRNVIFKNGFDNLTAALHVTGDDVSFIDVETRDNDSTKHCDYFIHVTAAARFNLLNWVHRGGKGKTGPIAGLHIDGASEDVIVIPKWIDGDFSTGLIVNDSTAIGGTGLQVFGSAHWPAYMRTRNGTNVIATAVDTTKGHYGPYLNIRLKDDSSITNCLVGADMEFFAPISVVNADGERSTEWTGTQSSS